MTLGTVFVVFTGLGAFLLAQPVPRQRAFALLNGFGKRLGPQFVFTADGKLTSGPEVEYLLLTLVMRQTRASGAFLLGVGLSWSLVIYGPPLSQSNLTSALAAGCAASGIIGAYLLQRPFLTACSPAAGAVRTSARIDSYIGPLRRALCWAAAASVLAIPVLFALASTTDAYDGSLFYWEGLVLLPLVTVGTVVAIEVSSRRLRDSTADVGLVYLWDVFRERALRMLTLVVLYAAAMSWTIARDGLVGVAQTSAHRPDWVNTAANAADGLALLFAGTALVLSFVRVSRFRQQLWPDLAPTDIVRWGVGVVPRPN